MSNIILNFINMALLSESKIDVGSQKKSKKKEKKGPPNENKDSSTISKKQISRISRDMLNRGLSTPLNSDNRGFNMLKKMGFTPGQSLGKSQSGISEPLPFSIKPNRKGLGGDKLNKAKKKKEKIQAEAENAKINYGVIYIIHLKIGYLA